MTFIVITISNVLASLTLLGALAALGLPVYVLARRFGLTDRAPLGLCWLFGLVWLLALTWYGLAVGIRPSSVYRGVLIAAPILGGLALVLFRPRRESGLRSGKVLAADVGFDLLAFTAAVSVYAGLLFSRLRPDDLPWATILNGDIYVYLKSAAWLAFAPVVVPGVGYMDFSSFVRVDVFGCFNLLAFERFLLHTGIENVPIPTLGVAVGMIGVAVARSCRLVFRLGSPLSIALALTTTTGPVFLYVVLNYFLGQMVFVSILLTVALQVLEPRDGGVRPGVGRSLVLAAGAMAAVLCYDVWALQFAVLIAALLAVAEAVTTTGKLWRRALVAGLSFAAWVALALGAMALASPTRLMASVAKLIIDSVPNIAGWALPFVDLNLLLGLPVEWQGMDTPRPGILGPNLGFALLIAVLLIAMAKLDRGPGHVARRLTLGCFCATVAAYLAVWFKFGETYQQWKFASTLPLGFGFAVLAAASGLARLEPSRALRTVSGVGIAAFLATCVISNVGIARDTFMTSLAHHPRELARLARSLDRETGGKPIHVTIDDFNARHAALVLLNHRPTTFDGLTMFGPSPPPPADGRWTELTTTCGSAGKPEALYAAAPATHGHLPSLTPGVEVALSSDAATCVTLSGFGAIQPSGRVTEAKVATVRFRCDCAPLPGGYDLVLHAGLPDGVDRETVRFTVDGGPPQVLPLTGAGIHDIVLPLPVGLHDGDPVDVSIEGTGGPTVAAEPVALSVAGLIVVKKG